MSGAPSLGVIHRQPKSFSNNC